MEHYTLKQAEHWMNYAFDMAKKAIEVGEVPVGAVFVKHPLNEHGAFIFEEGEIVSSGHNLTNQRRNVMIIFN